MKKTFFFFFFALLFGLIACTLDKAPQNRDKEARLKKAEASIDYLEKGKEITAISFVALSSALQQAMQEGGVPKAIDYCNLAALPILDSLSRENGVTIRRTSLQVRNPKDTPTSREKEVLEDFHQQMKNGEAIKPFVYFEEGAFVRFFAPIKVNTPCLNCHGVIDETMKAADYALIQAKYPMDEAIGYQVGDLRGMWSVTFAQNSLVGQ